MDFDPERNKQIRWNKKDGLTNSINEENTQKYNEKYNTDLKYNKIVNLALLEYWKRYL